MKFSNRSFRFFSALTGGVLLAAFVAAGGPVDKQPTAAASEPPVHTFSIVAFDPATGDLGIAVASKVLGVGSVVPWAKAEVGAIATQASANTSYGPAGLKLLESGKNARETLDALIESDSGRAHRQAGIVDAEGNVASFTGEECIEWAGNSEGDRFTVQGNLLTGADVIEDMAEAFKQAREVEDSELADWLMAALKAGDDAGGDKRGKQSAALMVVREGAGYGGNDRYIDLRVEDHTDPVAELARLLEVHKEFFARSHRNKPQRETETEPQ